MEHVVDPVEKKVYCGGKEVTDKDAIMAAIKRYICEEVSKGKSLEVLGLNGVNSFPTKQEVYDWEEEDLEFNDRLRKAEVRRARSTIEAYYKNANEAMKSNDKEVVDLVNAKKKIADSAQACINQENSSVSIVINSALPRIWGLKEK